MFTRAQACPKFGIHHAATHKSYKYGLNPPDPTTCANITLKTLAASLSKTETEYRFDKIVNLCDGNGLRWLRSACDCAATRGGQEKREVRDAEGHCCIKLKPSVT